MTTYTPAHTPSRTERLTRIVAAFRTVFILLLVLGVGLPVLITVLEARRDAAEEASFARMLLVTDGAQDVDKYAVIVHRTDLTRIRLVDGRGTVLSSSDVGEVGRPIGDGLKRRIEKAGSGAFRLSVDEGGRRMTVTVVRDAPADRTILLERPARTLADAALPPVTAGIILSLAMGALIVARAWSWSAEYVQSVDTLENALRSALDAPTADAPDRLRAASSDGPLESAADLAAGLVERTCSAERASEAAAGAFMTVFDAIPHPAYIRTPDGRVVAANRTLCDELDRPAADLVNVPEAEVQRVLPIDRVRMLLDRRGFRSRGITGLLVSPSSNRLTIVPVTHDGREAHLVMLQLNDKNVHSVERDGPETPRGLRMAIELAESEGLLRAQRDSGEMIAPIEINRGLADLYGATDLAVWAIDENGRTLHWSRAARRLTGVWKREVPDVEAFCRVILTDEEQRQTLIRWLEKDATRLSRHLVCRIEDGTPIGLTWNADETLVRTRPGEMRRVTVLWCKAPVFDDVERAG